MEPDGPAYERCARRILFFSNWEDWIDITLYVSQLPWAIQYIMGGNYYYYR